MKEVYGLGMDIFWSRGIYKEIIVHKLTCILVIVTQQGQGK